MLSKRLAGAAQIGGAFLLMIALYFIIAAGGAYNGDIRDSAPTLIYSAQIVVPGATGSATVIGNVRYRITEKPITFSLLLTCAHVVRGAKWVKVSHQGRLFGAVVLAVDPKLDLALLEAKEHWTPAPLYFGPVREGEAERITGGPLGFPVMVSGGFIGAELTPVHGRFLRQGSASSYPGNSGSGVYVYRDGWQMAGVVDAGAVFQQDDLPPAFAPTVSLYIPMAAVRHFLRESGYL